MIVHTMFQYTKETPDTILKHNKLKNTVKGIIT